MATEVSDDFDLRKTHMEKILPFFDMPDVTEIMVNSFDSVFIKRKGVMEKTDVVFDNEYKIVTILKIVASSDGQTCDENTPEVNARLWDGSRFCGLLYPWSSKGTNFTIRLFPDKRITPDDLVAFGSITPDMLTYLKLAVKVYRNILISGSTDSGKTTLLNALATFVDPVDRFITVEDTQEIQVDLPNWLSHVAMDIKHSKSGIIVKSLADLIRTTLRENPTRICVGEIRDADAALAFMRALNTGHNGCFSTLHANDPIDAIARMAELLGEAGKPLEFAMKQVTSNLHVIIQAQEIKGVGKRVVQIMETSRGGSHQVMFDYSYQDKKHIHGEVAFKDSAIYKEAAILGFIN